MGSPPEAAAAQLWHISSSIELACGEGTSATTLLRKGSASQHGSVPPSRHTSDIDDDWGNMNKNGPSEMNGNAMEDMGLGPADLAEIVPA